MLGDISINHRDNRSPLMGYLYCWSFSSCRRFLRAERTSQRIDSIEFLCDRCFSRIAACGGVPTFKVTRTYVYTRWHIISLYAAWKADATSYAFPGTNREKRNAKFSYLSGIRMRIASPGICRRRTESLMIHRGFCELRPLVPRSPFDSYHRPSIPFLTTLSALRD